MTFIIHYKIYEEDKRQFIKSTEIQAYKYAHSVGVRTKRRFPLALHIV